MQKSHWRIDIFGRKDLVDAPGQSLLAEFQEQGLQGVRSIRSLHGFLLPAQLHAAQVEYIAKELLTDPITEQFHITQPNHHYQLPAKELRIDIMRKPGVMDPAAKSAERILREMKVAAQPIMTFRGYEIAGELAAKTIQEAIKRSVANETIEDVFVNAHILPFASIPSETPFVRREIPLRNCTDAQLSAISKDNFLALSLLEMKTIQNHFRELAREPTDAELETLAQTWSEHCKHKTLAGPVSTANKNYSNLLKETVFYATQLINAPWCISVFKDNAGIIEFTKDWAICFKVETHNHPSAIEPFGGAGTGIGGVIRDILGCGLGAKPIASTDVFCVGPLDLTHAQIPLGSLHPKRVLKGVVAGVRDYGNPMGIPTINGGVFVHKNYVGNPLVFCGNVGLIPRDKCFKEAQSADIILLVGGRTGRDGIHGATFSSVELHEESETVSSTAVQIGDPITEKKVMEGVLRARDLNLFHAITDCGAGGLSSAIGEMGEKLGAEVDLEKVPLKYPGLTYAEIWISEAQERMLLAVAPENLEKIIATFQQEEVEATPIGKFTNNKQLLLRWKGVEVGNLDMEFLHDGLPQTPRKATWQAATHKQENFPQLNKPHEFAETLGKILAAPNVASKEWIIRQYDHEVQAASVIKPLVGIRRDGPSDAAVIAPLPNHDAGIAIGCGMNPHYGEIDPYRMAASAIDESLRNVVAVGGDPKHTAILDNFSWGNCDKPENLGALVQAAEACRDIALEYQTPFISGKDSLNNEYRVGDQTIVIPPTLLISAIAKVPDIKHCITMDFKKIGSPLVLVGLTRCEFGGSHFSLLHKLAGGEVPSLDAKIGKRILHAVAQAIQQELVLACHDLSEGGLAVAAAEMAFAGGIGAEIFLDQIPCTENAKDNTCLMFSESNSRFLLEVKPENNLQLEEILDGVPWAWVGETTNEQLLQFSGLDGKSVLSSNLGILKQNWQKTFHW